MIILGIDPGLAIVGWGVIESVRGAQRPIAFGAITTPAHTLIESRLAMIESDLTEIINKYKPDEMAVEELFFNTNITTGIAVAEARGVIICTAHPCFIVNFTRGTQAHQVGPAYGANLLRAGIVIKLTRHKIIYA